MFRALVLCLMLMACGLTGTELSTDDSALNGHITRQFVISDHPHHVLLGYFLTVTRADETTRALVIQQRRDGVHNLRMVDAWQNGRELPYRAINRRLGCVHGHCRDNAIGLISFSAAMLERAARDGFNATLIGRDGAISIHAPATLFTAALATP